MIVPLNPEQEIAAESVHGNYVVIAGPGSGKTTLLVNRYLRMITKHGIKREDILNLTFTAEAARNMVDKVGLSNAKDVFRTFHSFALDLIMKEKDNLPFRVNSFVLPTQGQDFQLLKDLMKLYPAITTFRSLKDEIARYKASNISPEQATSEAWDDKKNGRQYFYACAYRDYEIKCREQGWLDFDGLIKEAVKLLETNDEVRSRWQRKYICVDESQDTDVGQEKLLKLIYAGNIFFVGDPNQLVYEWRSAQAGNLEKFVKDYDAKVLYSGANYRSTGQLVDFFKRILPVDNGLASHMVSMREYGEKPVITRYGNDEIEASQVLSQIKDLNNSAVIARTNRQLRVFQRVAMARGMKTMILGQKDLWQTNEVRHLLDIAKAHKESTQPAHEILTHLMDAHRLNHIYRNTGGPNEKPPVENLADIVKLSVGRGTVKQFLDWLRKLTFACEAAKSPSYERRDANPTLALTTVHQAKGREWKNVFVVGVKQGLMPHSDGEILEEKRIFFVACSRAADRLSISYYDNRSEFLEQFRDEIRTHESGWDNEPETPRAAPSTRGKTSAAELMFAKV
jgi:superfamily I DNA/RNA helicase